MAKFTRKKKLALMVTVLVTSAGAAFAYWTAGGAGTGSATSGNNVPITVLQTTVVTGLAPGTPAQVLSGNFDNTNKSSVYVATVTASISGVTKAGNAPSGTCDTTDYTLANPVMAVNADVPAGSAQAAWTGASIQFNNKATNQDACKGATVNLSYAIS